MKNPKQFTQNTIHTLKPLTKER